jgi:amidase
VLDKGGLRGARIGIPSDPSDPANDVIYGPLAPRFGVIMENAIAALEAAGAVLVRANLPTIAWMGGPGTEAPILNRNPESATFDQVERRPVIYLYELKHDLNAYLRDWAKGTKMKTMSDIIAFNKANANLALRFGQDIFLASDTTRGDLSEMEYLAARQMDILATRTLGLDAYMDANKLEAVLFPGRFGSNIPAKAGYPSVQVPGGMVRAPGAKPPPDYPFGVTFTGRAWSEPVLLRLAYAYEQATKARRPPPGMPALSTQCEVTTNARTTE